MALLALLLAALPGLALASRARVEWLTHQQRFCMAEEAQPSCEPGTIIDVYSAFYSKAWKAKCGAIAGPGGACKVNSTESVRQLCQGRASCSLPADSHPPECADHFSLRIVWDCVTGEPATAEEDTQREGEDETAPSEEETEEEREARELREFQTLQATPEKAAEQAKQIVQKVQKEPDHNMTFNFCYRNSRWQLLMQGTVFRRLTTCPEKEGCFKLHWADERSFTHPDHPPTAEDMALATLSKGEDSLWTTFFNVGLQRNDFYTWGVCLPKDSGVDLATAVFKVLQGTRKPLWGMPYGNPYTLHQPEVFAGGQVPGVHMQR